MQDPKKALEEWQKKYFGGSAALEHSGLERDAFDSRARESYEKKLLDEAAARRAATEGGFYVPTAAEQAAAQRRQNSAALYAALLAERQPEMERQAQALDAAGQELDRLAEMAQQGNRYAALLYGEKQESYRQQYGAYEQAYRPLYEGYGKAAQAAQESARREAERQESARKEGEVQAELDGVDRQIAGLEKARDALRRAKAQKLTQIYGAARDFRGPLDLATPELDGQIAELEGQIAALTGQWRTLDAELTASRAKAEAARKERLAGLDTGTAETELRGTEQEREEARADYERAFGFGFGTARTLGDAPEEQEERREAAADRMNGTEARYRGQFADLRDAKYLQADAAYKALREREDFAEKSAWDRSADDPAGLYFEVNHGGVQGARLTEEERSTFNYLWNTQGGTAAEAYLEHMQGELNRRRREAWTERAQSWAEKHPALASAASVAAAPLKVISRIGQWADYLDGDWQIDRNAAYNAPVWLQSAVRQTVASRWGGAGSFLYQTGMSMFDFLFNTAITGGNASLALAVMGTEAAADETARALDRGLTGGQAMALGSIAGMAEVLTERVSIEALFSQEWEESIGRYLVKNILAEGSEEGASDLINLAADLLLARDKGQWREAIDTYRRQGKTEREAFRAALLDQVREIGLDMAGGALSGGVMAGSNAAVSTGLRRGSTAAQRGRALREDGRAEALIDTALGELRHTRAGQLAAELQEEYAQGRTDDYRLGLLAQLTAQETGRDAGEETGGAVPSGNENAAPGTGTATAVIQDYQRVERHGETLAKMRAHLPELEKMDPVAALTGNEFQKSPDDSRNLRTKVIDFFNSIGNKVFRQGMGEIELNNAGARDSLEHGYGKLKAATFAALPQVLEQGALIETGEPYEGHNYDSFYIAAPVTVGGEPCYVCALVVKDDKMQRYKLHEVLVTNSDGAPLFQSESSGKAGPLRNDAPSGDPRGLPVTEHSITQRTNPVNTGDALEGKRPRLPTYEQAERKRQAARARTELERTGILCGVQKNVIARVERLCRLLGAEAVFYDEDGANGVIEDGYYDRGDGRIHLNARSKNPAAQVLIHEITHRLEGSEAYGRLSRAILDRLEAEGVLARLRETIRERYARRGTELTPEGIDQEIVAAYAEKRLLTDEAAIRDAVAGNRSFGRWMLEQLDRLLARLGNESAQERTFLADARRMYAAALEAGTEQSGAQREGERAYSIKNTRRESIEDQLSDYRAKRMNAYDEFYYGDTPQNLQSAGLDTLPLVLSQSDFKKSRSEKHNVPNRAMKRIAELMADPILIWENGDSVSVLTKEIDGDGKPLLIGIERNVNLDNERVNRIKSAYGLDHPMEWMRNQQANGGTLHVFDKNRADSYLNYVGYKAERTDSAYSGATIAEAGADVNPENPDEARREAAVQHSYSRTAEEQEGVLEQLRGYLAGRVSRAELARYVDAIDGRERAAQPEETGSEAQEIVTAAHREGASVEEYLRRNWERYEYDGELNGTAREALALERSGRQHSYSEEEITGPLRTYLPGNERARVDRAREMLDNGATRNEVYNETGIVVMANGELLSGFGGKAIGRYEDGKAGQRGVLRSGEGKIGDRIHPAGDGRRLGAGTEGQSRTRYGSWKELAESERRRIITDLARRMSQASDEGKDLLNAFGSSEAMAERFYSMMQEGRVVAEQWSYFIPDIQGLMDEVDQLLTDQQTPDRQHSYSEEDEPLRLRLPGNERAQLDRAREMLDNGAGRNKVYNRTGIMLADNGDLRAGPGGEVIGRYEDGRAGADHRQDREGKQIEPETARRSDRPERRRALQKGEMVNEFRDKINWREYYRKIKDSRYDPDRFEDGEKADMLLDGRRLTLQMQPNGEWSVTGMEEYHDGHLERGRAETAAEDGAAGIRGERGDDRFVRASGRSEGVRADGSYGGQRSDGAGDGESGAAVSPLTPERQHSYSEEWLAEQQANLDEVWAAVHEQAARPAEEAATRPEELVSAGRPKERRSFREAAEDTRSFLARKFVDAGDQVKRIGRTLGDRYLYAYYNLARASISAGAGMIEDGQTDIYGRRTGKSLNAIFDPIRAQGDEYYEAFQLYLDHMHNVDRMQRENRADAEAAAEEFRSYRASVPELLAYDDEQIREMALDGQSEYHRQAARYVELMERARKARNTRNKPVFGWDVTAEKSRAAAAELARQHPEFEELAREVYGYIDNLMRYRVDSGLITQDEYARLKAIYPHYVPTYRDGAQSAGQYRTDQVMIGRTVGRAVGGSEPLTPLHEALARQTLSVVREGSKNRFGQRLLELGAQKDERTAKHVRKVQEYEGQFSEDTFDQQDEAPRRSNTFVVLRDGQRYEMTVSPALFEAVEALSAKGQEENAFLSATRKANDLFKSLVTSKNPAFLVKNFLRDLQDAGLNSKDLSEFAKHYPKAVKEIVTGGEYWQRYRALGGVYYSFFNMATGETEKRSAAYQKTVGWIEALNEGVEQAPRLAEFMATVDKAGGLEQADMDTLMEAMYNAAEVTVNFGRAGTWSKFLNTYLIPFWNPGIQGFDKMIRNVTETRGARDWLRLAVKAAALGVAPRVINGLLYRDDEDWKEISDSVKDAYYLFKIGDGVWLRLPKGRVLSVIGTAADRAADLARGEKVDWREFIQFVGSQTAPSDPFSNNIFANWVRADLFDRESPGKTWYGGDIESQRLRSLAPGERYDARTDKVSKWLGAHTGLSPKKINYLLDQYTGVIGDFLLPAITPAAERGMLSAAFTLDSTASNRLSGEFYGKRDELTYAKNRPGRTGADMAVYRYWNKQEDLVGEVNAAIREIEADETLSGGDKRELLRAQYQIRNALERAALDSFEDYAAAAERYYTQSADLEDEDARTELAYRMANRDVLGAEYALRVYSRDVYEKARELEGQGVSYEETFRAYFAAKDAAAGLTGAAANEAKRKAMLDCGLDDRKTVLLYQTYNGAVNTHAEDFREASLSEESLYRLAAELLRLVPQDGSGQVTSLQKYRAVVDAGLSEQEQRGALSVLMPETEYQKLEAGRGFGVTPAAYVAFREALPDYDADGSGTYTQAEVKAALDSFGMTRLTLPGAGNRRSVQLTRDQKAALWQLANRSWKPENNPYSAAVGRRVLNATGAAGGAQTAGGGGIRLPTGASGGLTLPTGSGSGSLRPPAASSGRVVLPTGTEGASGRIVLPRA